MTIVNADDTDATFNQGTVIKVIGVGGAGGNAVNHMIRKRVQGVEFICANTDAQALRRAETENRIQLGKTGLGAGANPAVGKEAALEIRSVIEDALRGAHMVFITAGMGGGTGTGAAPVVASVAREMGILTVAVVTRPFQFEGSRRGRAAEAGLAALQENVDSLIVVHNEKLHDVMGEDATMDECFQTADDVLKNAVAGISEIINVEGNINVDFEDLRTVMRAQGKAMMGMAEASGPDRARLAAAGAIASPLLDGVSLAGAQGLLINITAASSLKLRESRQIVDIIRQHASEEAAVIFGTARDDSMGEAVRVTVVATGLGGTEPARVESARPAATASLATPSATALVHTPSPRHLETVPLLNQTVPAREEPPSNAWRSARSGDSATGLAFLNGGRAAAPAPSAPVRATLHREVGTYSPPGDFEIPAFLRKQANA